MAISLAVASALLIIAGNWMVNRIPAGKLLAQFGSSSYDNVIWNWVLPIAALLLAMRETHRYSDRLRTEAIGFEPGSA